MIYGAIASVLNSTLILIDGWFQRLARKTCVSDSKPVGTTLVQTVYLDLKSVSDSDWLVVSTNAINS